jgi:hypothetical protein
MPGATAAQGGGGHGGNSQSGSDLVGLLLNSGFGLALLPLLPLVRDRLGRLRGAR